jgi:hypothetical protein
MLLSLHLFLHQIQSAAKRIHFHAVRPSSELPPCGKEMNSDHYLLLFSAMMRCFGPSWTFVPNPAARRKE